MRNEDGSVEFKKDVNAFEVDVATQLLTEILGKVGDANTGIDAYINGQNVDSTLERALGAPQPEQLQLVMDNYNVAHPDKPLDQAIGDAVFRGHAASTQRDSSSATNNTEPDLPKWTDIRTATVRGGRPCRTGDRRWCRTYVYRIFGPIGGALVGAGAGHSMGMQARMSRLLQDHTWNELQAKMAGPNSDGWKSSKRCSVGAGRGVGTGHWRLLNPVGPTNSPLNLVMQNNPSLTHASARCARTLSMEISPKEKSDNWL